MSNSKTGCPTCGDPKAKYVTPQFWTCPTCDKESVPDPVEDRKTEPLHHIDLEWNLDNGDKIRITGCTFDHTRDPNSKPIALTLSGVPAGVPNKIVYTRPRCEECGLTKNEFVKHTCPQIGAQFASDNCNW